MNQAREGTESALPRPLALGALWGLPSGDFRGYYKAMPQGKQNHPFGWASWYSRQTLDREAGKGQGTDQDGLRWKTLDLGVLLHRPQRQELRKAFGG